MQRIPEPELMNEPEQARAYAEADFSAPHDAFVAHFRQRFPGFAGGAAIDLGCGPADVTMRFARAYPEAAILGLDGAQAMLDLGRKAVDAEGLGQRLTLQQCCLPDTDLPPRAFDAVISNSLLHHLDDPAVLWQTVRHVARRGAALLVMDLMRPASAAEAESLTQRYAADAPPVLQRDFHHSLLAAYRPDEVRQQLDAAGLEQLRVEAVSDRHLLVWGTIHV
ncbi:SAM-dependent methyltransferase [Sulfurimicrobium lacus]|uniref:SAM-dependent methyltransferase n=1 Tax=Sulfurimicrobium lacus TaxID=2715678 RepID=A0A6F8V6B2_9PROT|nr:class I SAM-dependent methyltransferase [Sulfurimicrobium lacus]BCB25194.1 SAM-dependent methyltransferase [Sulfurimicrobium lacus]